MSEERTIPDADTATARETVIPGSAPRRRWILPGVLVGALAISLAANAYLATSLLDLGRQNERGRDAAAQLMFGIQYQREGQLYGTLNALDHAGALLQSGEPPQSERIERLWATRSLVQQEHLAKQQEHNLHHARHQLEEARRLVAEEDGEAFEAVKLCTFVVENVEGIATEEASTLRSDSEQLAARLISTRGVILDPMEGSLLPGFASQKKQELELYSDAVKTLRAKGYVPLWSIDPLEQFWHRDSPYHLVVRVDGEETPEENAALPSFMPRYEVTAALRLRGQEVWTERFAVAADPEGGSTAEVAERLVHVVEKLPVFRSEAD